MPPLLLPLLYDIQCLFREPNVVLPLLVFFYSGRLYAIQMRRYNTDLI